MSVRAQTIARRLADGLRSEVGGWTVIGVLMLALIVLSAAFVIAPRVAPTAPALNPVDAVSPVSDFEPSRALTVTVDELQPMSLVAARAWNAALPASTAPSPPARPFVMPASDALSYGRALDCLTAAIYYEAGAETHAGQAAVAQVVLNRLRHPAYPRTVCGVVFQGSQRASGCQFTFTCDGALTRAPSVSGWARAKRVASAALNGQVLASVGTATHYHTDTVAPVWAPRLVKIVQLEAHIFYRWPGAWGQLRAFTAASAEAEPEIAQMAGLSTTMRDVPISETVLVKASTPAPPQTPPQVLASLPVSTTLAEVDSAVAPILEVTPLQVRSTRRDVAVVSDPLSNPGEIKASVQRPGRRIPVPSAW